MIRRNVLWFITVVVAALVQTTWVEQIAVSRVVPDLTLLTVVYFAMAIGEERAMYTGVLGGVILDIASNETIGHFVLCYVIVGYTVARISARMMTEHPAAKAILVFCAAIAFGLLWVAVAYVQDPSVAALNNIVARVVPGAFYTALFTPVLFFAMDRLFKRRKEWKLSGGLIG
ncbi:MAG TPA: rod shape-determining protein MreD [Candidatus Hydrogenedentes bacterium]|nr:rod shape-determining protein MreD [Candidatus Hydrogenedentota bacterium]